MNLRRNITFRLRPYGKTQIVYQIRMDVSYAGKRVQLRTGCMVTSQEAWDSENQLVVSGYRGPKVRATYLSKSDFNNLMFSLKVHRKLHPNLK